MKGVSRCVAMTAAPAFLSTRACSDARGLLLRGLQPLWAVAMQATSSSRIMGFEGLAPCQRLALPQQQPFRPHCPAPLRVARLEVQAAAMTRRETLRRRHHRIRNKISGAPERPRLAVFRSNNHIYAQVIDDTAAITLVAASTLTAEIREELNGKGGDKQAAELVGRKIAELCLARNIDRVSFDRGGNLYHGRVQALADAARAGGLAF